ncbi:MAG: Gfo/Idh/MocA family protein [Flexilinea sp.]
MGKIIAGVAGTGFIGPVHVECLRRLNIPVKGISGSTPKKALESAEELGLEKGYASFEEMINDPEITVIHICSPNNVHFKQARTAMLAGKHVICEKPLALDSNESAELIRIAKETNRVTAVNFNLRYYPMNHEARSIIRDEAAFGKIFTITGCYFQDWLLKDSDWSWRLDQKINGNLRTVADIASHWIDLIRFITGRNVISVFSDFETFIKTRKKPEHPVAAFSNKLISSSEYVEVPVFTEDFASILLRMEDGIHGQVNVSQMCSGRKNRLFYEINGSKKSIAFDQEKCNELWIGNRDKANEILMRDPSLVHDDAREIMTYPGGHLEGYSDTLKQHFSKIYKYIQQGNYEAKRDFATFEDGHYILKVNEAIEKSSKEERWVNLE